jgi:recombination protein RecR
MSVLPEQIEDLITSLKILPGVGQKTAERLAFYLLRIDDKKREDLAKNILSVKDGLKVCERCFAFTDRDICELCSDYKRDDDILCVVEDFLDLVSMEKGGFFRGRYHVLGGVLSPLDGVRPSDLRIVELIKRVQDEGISELVIALNPTMEGESTSVYISERLEESGVKITRLARGIPVGGDLEYADMNTLKKAFEGRVGV